MSTEHEMTARFEANRSRLRAIGVRMLGNLSEADDAIQETWLRVQGISAAEIQHLEGWLVTVFTRICLDVLRSRKARPEESLDEGLPVFASSNSGSPEEEAIMAESVGIALLVVLDRLTPPERLAFVLHDIFAVSFEEIASILQRTPESARQLASRARKRVRDPQALSNEIAEQKNVVETFLVALRAGDLQGVLAVLDPAVVRYADARAVPDVMKRKLSGSNAVANEAVSNIARARFARVALIDGQVGVIVAPGGKLMVALRCKISNGKIVEFDAIAVPENLRKLQISTLSEGDIASLKSDVC